jgi:hypothetical protein
VGAVVTTTAEINVRGGGVNSGGSNERGASVAMGSDGRFFVSYTATNPANGSADVRVNYYDTNGVRLESHLIAGSAFNEFSQDIGVNGNGNAVVIYQDLNTIGFVDIFARRISTAGTVSNAIQVTTRNELEFNAVVAVNTINPSFAVAYQVINPISGRPEVRVTEVSFVGGDPEALDAIRRRTLRFGNLNRSRTVPALSIDLLGNYQVVYTLLNPFSNNGQDIFAARRRLN